MATATYRARMAEKRAEGAVQASFPALSRLKVLLTAETQKFIDLRDQGDEQAFLEVAERFEGFIEDAEALAEKWESHT